MQELPRKLGLLDAVAVIVGTVIGAGIFLVPNLVARHLGSPAPILAAWAAAGVLSFFGGLAYAELGAMMPLTGGQYLYLRAAYGPLAAFLCGWAFFLVLASGAIAWLAVSFALSLSYFVPLSGMLSKAAAVILIAAATAVNYRGVKPGAIVQDASTALKVLGLAVLMGAAFLHRAPRAQDLPAVGFDAGGFGMALVVCLMAYDGWANISFVAGEVRRPQRNLPLALAAGIGACIAIYVLANVSYLRILSVREIGASERVGALAADRAIGPIGAGLVSGVILLSVAGTINGWMMTAPRIYFAQARDGLFFRRFGAVHPRFQTPYVAVLVQGVWAAILVLTGSYEALISYAMFAAWLFYGLTAIGVILLRRKDPARPRPYRMWGYPATPVLFAAVALALVVNTLARSPAPSLAGVALIAAGIPVYFLWRRQIQ